MESSQNKSCCLICYKKYCKGSDNPNHHDKVVTSEEKSRLKIFWKMFRRYLAEQQNGENGDNRLIEESINNGTFGTCQECFKIIQDFCSLFKDMEMIGLLLNRKVVTLKNIMFCAERVPARVSNLAEIASETEVSVKFILDMKTRLIENCNRKLINSFPKLQLKKCDQHLLQNDKTLRLEHDNDELEIILSNSPKKTNNNSNDNKPHRNGMELPTSAATSQKGGTNTGFATTTPSSSPSQLLHCQINKSGSQSSSTPTLQMLMEHKQMEMTHECLLFKCGYCPKTQTRSGALVQHIKQRHRDKSGAPRQLKINIISKGSNVEVSKLATNNNNIKGNEAKHCRTALPRGQLGNSNNLKTTNTSLTRKIPSLIGTSVQQRPFACIICKKTYRHYNSLKIHKSAVHEGLKYKCGYCPTVKTQLGHLKIHIRQSHKDNNNGAPLPCKFKVVRNNGNTGENLNGFGDDSGESNQRQVVVITLVKEPPVEKDLTKYAVSHPDTNAIQRNRIIPMDDQEVETGIITTNGSDSIDEDYNNESNSIDEDYNNQQKIIKEQMECEIGEVKLFQTNAKF